MAQYEFTTLWRVRAPQEKVWDLIFHSDQWPNWWRGVVKVEKVPLNSRDRQHCGNRRSGGALVVPFRKSSLPAACPLPDCTTPS
ncbi:MAG TPA: hypothetical protein VLA93_22220 [Pyrinomonadaceae bacterium]|nr:hypothetical protein [Pyrinomonadaceae bacterium]